MMFAYVRKTPRRPCSGSASQSTLPAQPASAHTGEPPGGAGARNLLLNAGNAGPVPGRGTNISQPWSLGTATKNWHTPKLSTNMCVRALKKTRRQRQRKIHGQSLKRPTTPWRHTGPQGCLRPRKLRNDALHRNQCFRWPIISLLTHR